jgi:hypothetical protein
VGEAVFLGADFLAAFLPPFLTVFLAAVFLTRLGATFLAAVFLGAAFLAWATLAIQEVSFLGRKISRAMPKNSYIRYSTDFILFRIIKGCNV